MDEAALAFRFGLGTIFFLSGLSKFPNLEAFRQVIRAYRVGPRRYSRALALTIPSVETVAGLCLLAGVAVRGAGIAVVLMLAAFSLAVTINLVRGRRIACGCFGTVSQREISAFAVVRNIVFIALAVVVVDQSPTTLSFVAASGTAKRLSDSDGLATLFVGSTGALVLAVAQEGLVVARSRRLFTRRMASAP